MNITSHSASPSA
jgi:hypothetical protein